MKRIASLITAFVLSAPAFGGDGSIPLSVGGDGSIPLKLSGSAFRLTTGQDQALESELSLSSLTLTHVDAKRLEQLCDHPDQKLYQARGKFRIGAKKFDIKRLCYGPDQRLKIVSERSGSTLQERAVVETQLETGSEKPRLRGRLLLVGDGVRARYVLVVERHTGRRE